MVETYLGLGSNLGSRADNLFRAVGELIRLGPLERSSWYETPPVDMPGVSERFLNGAVRLWTDLTLPELARVLNRIEQNLGRRPDEKGRNLSRTIDIDILFYDGEVFASGDLVVPHPRLHERAFVLVPLAELAPDLRHPVLGLTVEEMLARVARDGIKKWNGD